MRLRYLGLGCLLLGGGCLVPRYDYDPPGVGGGAGAAGASGGSTSGGSAGSGSAGVGKGGGGSGGQVGCSAPQKECGGECVAIDDPAYGCTPTSCDQLACPVAGEGTLACEGGECVVGSCGPGSKKCDGKCVAVDDPTYGCSEAACDGSVCPDPAGGTVICNQGSCEVGECTGSTKECDGKCVPTDRNNGCGDPTSCDPCDSSEACSANNMACECQPIDPCLTRDCGEATGRCGEKVQCGDCEEGVCEVNTCQQCLEDEHCPVSPNPCLAPSCDGKVCGVQAAPPNTRCAGGGTCSQTRIGLCERAPISIGGGNDIDAFEVTRGHYYHFTAEVAAPPTGLPPACNWKTSYVHDFAEHAPEYDDFDVPVAWVDWCDAWAYCNHVGRRLCGKVGGGATPIADFDKAGSSQWMRACTGPSMTYFPYGADPQPGYCHDQTGPREPQPVGSFPMCEGGYPDVFDLSGSLSEWEDSCQAATGKADACRLRGGDLASGEDLVSNMACSVNGTSRRDSTGSTVGFRCCSK